MMQGPVDNINAHGYDYYVMHENSGWSGGGGVDTLVVPTHGGGGSNNRTVNVYKQVDDDGMYMDQNMDYGEEPRYYGIEDQYVASSADQPGLIDDEGHLQVTDVYGHQSITIDTTISTSLEELAKNPTAATWRPQRAILDEFKRNKRLTDRENATDADRAGDLSKLVILKAELIDTFSSCPVQVGFRMPGIEPRVISRNSKYVWTINPESNHVNVNQSIHAPNNILTLKMAAKYETCNRTSLDKQIRFDIADNPDLVAVDTSKFAWEVVMKNAHMWPDRMEQLYRIDQDRENGQLTNKFVEIPKQIGATVYKAIAEQQDTIEKSFIDARKLAVIYHRTDGEAWNQCLGLGAEANGTGDNGVRALETHKLKKPFIIGAKIRLEYTLQED